MTAATGSTSRPIQIAARDGNASRGGVGEPRHHGNHGGLLHHAGVPTAPADVDAIIVPTARRVAALREAFRLAGALGCPLVALCSHWSSANHAYIEARACDTGLIASDVHNAVTLPPLATSRRLAGTRFATPGDLSLKRNIALAVATMVGWKRVVLLDDDIQVPEPNHLRDAAAHLSTYNMVALRNVGFPDNSVVCHAIRRVSTVQDLGIAQSSFVGGGAMAVPADRTASFFPGIYNEDWFFMLSDKQINPVAVTGEVAQAAYDPFADPRRARAEEFGDCLAEGVYSILDDQGSVQDADHRFWHGFLSDRKRLVERVLSAVPLLRLDTAERDRMIASLKAAQGRREHITPQLCVDYLDDWRSDLELWRRYLEGLPRDLSPSKALQHLGLRTRITGPC